MEAGAGKLDAGAGKMAESSVGKMEDVEEPEVVLPRHAEFAIADTMLGGLVHSRVGEGRAEVEVDASTLAMMQVLRYNAINSMTLDRLLVRPEQLQVALVNQFARVPCLHAAVLPLLRQLSRSASALESVEWRDVVKVLRHGDDMPSEWRQYVDGHVDADGATAMHAAARKCDEVRVVELLESHHGAQLCGCVDDGGETVLMVAVATLPTQVVERILETGGADGCAAAAVAPDGSTALTRACCSASEETVLALLRVGAAGCNAAHVDSDGHTALTLVLKRSMSNAALALIGFGATACRSDHVTPRQHSALLWACRRGLPKVAMALVALGPDAAATQQADEEGDTALMWACVSDPLLEEAAVALVALGPQACAACHTNRQGQTALLVACRHHRRKVAHALLDLGGDACRADATDVCSITALISACSFGMWAVVKRLLALGATECNLQQPASSGATAFMHACTCAPSDVVDAMIACGPEACNAQAVDASGNTALLFLASSDREDIALTVLDAFGPAACLAAEMNTMSRSAFALACCHNNLRLAAALLALGAEWVPLDIEDAAGMTPFMYACGAGSGQIAAQMLARFGAAACMPAKVQRRKTALMIALTNGASEAVSALLDVGAEACQVSEIDQDGYTTLMHACSAPDMEEYACRMLTEFGPRMCRISAASGSNETALSLACRCKKPKVALQLLAFGAKHCRLKLRNTNRHTPLMLACEAGLSRVALTMLELGAGADRVDSNGFTVLMYACKSRLPTVVRALLERDADAILLTHKNRQRVSAQSLLRGVDSMADVRAALLRKLLE